MNKILVSFVLLSLFQLFTVAHGDKAAAIHLPVIQQLPSRQQFHDNFKLEFVVGELWYGARYMRRMVPLLWLMAVPSHIINSIVIPRDENKNTTSVGANAVANRLDRKLGAMLRRLRRLVPRALYICVLGPIVEEIVFRGGGFALLKNVASAECILVAHMSNVLTNDGIKSVLPFLQTAVGVVITRPSSLVGWLFHAGLHVIRVPMIVTVSNIPFEKPPAFLDRFRPKSAALPLSSFTTKVADIATGTRLMATRPSQELGTTIETFRNAYASFVTAEWFARGHGTNYLDSYLYAMLITNRLFVSRNNLWASIGAHMANNAFYFYCAKLLKSVLQTMGMAAEDAIETRPQQREGLVQSSSDHSSTNRSK